MYYDAFSSNVNEVIEIATTLAKDMVADTLEVSIYCLDYLVQATVGLLLY